MDGVRLNLALLGHLNLGRGKDTCLNHLPAKGGSLLRGNVEGGSDVGGNRIGMSTEELGNRRLDRLIGDGSLGGLRGTLLVTLVELVDGFEGKGDKVSVQVTLGNSGKKFTISHIDSFSHTM